MTRALVLLLAVMSAGCAYYNAMWSAERYARDAKFVVAIYVVVRPGATLTADALITWAREHVASYKAPRVVHFVEDIPRTRNGKVLRRALRPELAQR